jgi:hypothetical protein
MSLRGDPMLRGDEAISWDCFAALAMTEESGLRIEYEEN